MRRFVLSAGVAAAAGLAGVGAAVASDGAGNRQFVVTAVQTSATQFFSDEGLIGSRFLGADDLAVDGQAAGRGVRSCEVVAPGPAEGTGTFQCLFTLDLREGSITLHAAPTLTERGLDDVRAAVSGGTGAFRHARGEALVREVGPTETRFAIDIR